MLHGWHAALFPGGRSGIRRIRTGEYRDHAEPMQSALRKTRFWAGLREHHPHLTPKQNKAINKLHDAGPQGFEGGMSTEKYVNLCGVSRATAYRELKALCDLGLLTQTGVGRATRYRLREQALEGISPPASSSTAR
jgi:Fic family protein